MKPFQIKSVDCVSPKNDRYDNKIISPSHENTAESTPFIKTEEPEYIFKTAEELKQILKKTNQVNGPVKKISCYMKNLDTLEMVSKVNQLKKSNHVANYGSYVKKSQQYLTDFESLKFIINSNQESEDQQKKEVKKKC